MRKIFLSGFIILFYAANSLSQKIKIDSLISELGKAREDTSKVNIYRNLSGSVRFTDLKKAIEYGQKGILLSKRLGFDKGTAGCYLNVSTAYIYSDKLDTALLYLDTALMYAHKTGDKNRLGLAYLNRADIYRQMQNFNQSLQDCETALKFADMTNNDDVRARVYQTIGAVYYQQDVYPQGIIYYDKAIVLYRKTGNLRMSAVVLNNLGLIYKSAKEFPRAVAAITEAIRITDSLNDITNLSIFNGNLSDAWFQMEQYKEAEIFADKAMAYAVKQNNERLIAVAWTFKGNIYLKQKRFAEAIDALNKALLVFTEIDDTDRINTTADLLAEAYAFAGNYSKAYENMRISRQANDSIVKWKYDDDIAAMQTKFKVDEKDKEIQLLAKDKELQQQQLKQQRYLMTGAAAIAVLSLMGVWLFINRNRLRQQMKELKLRNQIAADLHDEVGSSLSSIHMLSQMANSTQTENNDQKIFLDKVCSNAKETMERMSDIVWMIKPGETETGSLRQRMEFFASEICSSKDIRVSLDLSAIENVRLTMSQRKNVYLVFKEAINNAVKYSGSKKIDVKAAIDNRQLLLSVKDYGKGFEISLSTRGNGLDNMRNRAKELNGGLEVTSAGSGTTIDLAVPV
jgi:signal transduction histidine kinase